MICTHQAIFLILFASAVCGCFVICRCCLTRNRILPTGAGIAQSNALVTIEQNGFVVYQKEVPPRPFAITDLQLAGGGADLDVSVKEADGSVTTYLVPYAAVPNMLQPRRVEI